MIRQLVDYLIPRKDVMSRDDKQISDSVASSLEGAWLNPESGSHMYIKIINGELIAPYCYDGNDELTAEYYNWKKIGSYWFARFRWFRRSIAGIALYQLTDENLIEGKWWYDRQLLEKVFGPEDLPPEEIEGGVRTIWEKRNNVVTPPWAYDFFKDRTE
jgi:hypothetical protein